MYNTQSILGMDQDYCPTVAISLILPSFMKLQLNWTPIVSMIEILIMNDTMVSMMVGESTIGLS